MFEGYGILCCMDFRVGQYLLDYSTLHFYLQLHVPMGQWHVRRQIIRQNYRANRYCTRYNVMFKVCNRSGARTQYVQHEAEPVVT